MGRIVALQINQSFTTDKWNYIIEQASISETSFIFFEKIDDLKDTRKNIHSVFCLNFDLKLLEYLPKVLMVYVGISDIDYLDNFNLPKNLKLNFSKGIASKFISEYNLMVSLSLIRNFRQSIINQASKIWSQKDYLTKSLKSLKDYSVGIIGMGHNGSETGKLFKKIGCDVSYLSLKEVELEFTSKHYSFSEKKIF